jgi:putative endonuclease
MPVFMAPGGKGMRKYYVYIMTSPTGTLYTGMTNDLKRRVYEHKQKLKDGFTKKYNVTRLAYYEETSDVHAALAREKEIKKWRRSKKIALIKSMNPKWQDLSEGWYPDVV